MIVMIFVTQNNFQNGPGVSNLLLGFYPFVSFASTLNLFPAKVFLLHILSPSEKCLKRKSNKPEVFIWRRLLYMRMHKKSECKQSVRYMTLK